MTQWPLALLLALSSKQNLIAGGQTHTLLLSDMCVCVCAFANNSGKDNNDADSMAKSMWTAQQMQAAVYSAVGDLISIRHLQQWDHLRVDVQLHPKGLGGVWVQTSLIPQHQTGKTITSCSWVCMGASSGWSWTETHTFGRWVSKSTVWIQCFSALMALPLLNYHKCISKDQQITGFMSWHPSFTFSNSS